MQINQITRTAMTLAVGTTGAVAMSLAGFPAAPLVGAALATSALAWSGVKLYLPTRLRDMGFLVIGSALGSGFRHEILGQVGGWALSLILLCLSIYATIAISRLILMKGFGKDSDTALLASSPGTLSLALSLAADGRGDATAVLILQCMRLLILSAVLPLGMITLGINPGASGGPTVDLAALPLIAVLVAGAAVSWLIAKRKFPAAYLLGGMVVSAVAHVTDLVHGMPPEWLRFAGFCVTGSVMGVRFTGIRPADILRLAVASIASVGAAALISMGFAGVTAALTGLPFGQVWVAYAPGGVEAMAAIGLALDFDGAYVAVHHLCRITFLLVLIPWMARRRNAA
ncbi:AbrB family transcriptional regulator [Donghicola mangrovi]|uniref:AbrB family transcriptional regulator n=1 Tax=Donghicola mangrovi TaxID=2729614 RepID=A0A850Q7H1_9RHOB|nr:AbrB family transcriptional regulator [Donghicola mangrovi]NVO22690.1 AbrB family transcriptional regulator [Donghicola mangrovi]